MRASTTLVVCCALMSCAKLVGIQNYRATDADSSVPTCFAGLSQTGTCPSQLVAGVNQTCVIGGGGMLYCWGYPVPGAVGAEAYRPSLVSTTLPPLQLSTSTTPCNSTTGVGTTCFYDNASNVSCWGDSDTDQLQVDSTVQVPPKLMQSGSGVVSVAVGGDHVCEMLADATLCWGADGSNQLDSGSGDGIFGPLLPATSSIVALGRSHTCIGSGSAGQVSCWGANESGELGDNTYVGTMGNLVTVMVDAPSEAPLEDVIALSAGASFTCALSGSASGADAYCWGADNAGQLGSGTTMTSSASAVPVPIQFTKIASGTATTCAIDVDTNVWCWGADQLGQAGVGPGSGTMLPATVAPTKTSVTDAIAIAVGDSHACAMQASGAIECWGGNLIGQLGDGSMSHMNPACGAKDCSWDPVVVEMP